MFSLFYLWYCTCVVPARTRVCVCVLSVTNSISVCPLLCLPQMVKWVTYQWGVDAVCGKNCTPPFRPACLPPPPLPHSTGDHQDLQTESLSWEHTKRTWLKHIEQWGDFDWHSDWICRRKAMLGSSQRATVWLCVVSHKLKKSVDVTGSMHGLWLIHV